MLDRERHEIILKKIIRDIYQETDLPALLAFKGGTCLYIFYGLDRFSTDLDFNITADGFNPDSVTNILQQHLTLDDIKTNKHNTWFWIGSFEKGKQKIKLEISKRDYPDKYVILDFYGLSINTMAPECMLSHKLCAISDRKMFQNRDIYDAYFMFKKSIDIDEKIIEIRTNKSPKEYFKYLINYIPKMVTPSTVLHGMGDLLSEQQKKWVKEKLVQELIFELSIRSSK